MNLATWTAISGSAERPDHVGAVIRRLRLERKMSLKELSRASGVSSGMLSQIERNLANPSLKILTKIQVALETNAAALFPGNAGNVMTERKDPLFVKRNHQRPFCGLGYLTKELLSTGTTQHLEMMLLHIPPKGSSGDSPLTSLSEKGGFVLEGTITMSVDGEEAVLGEGDSFAFDGRRPHAFRNDTDASAKVLWIISNFPMQRHL
ncbi:XRE family transcriptional regulator [uncultured Bosea sp.]|uniref:helix-turn-helix domain-containing protein n=1 Tax=uncultured Bosea sp. TaxID=211457 RepID=UPI0025F9E79B|nr:XRE family transcriptional regulator [uncultured Bosea sp.]